MATETTAAPSIADELELEAAHEDAIDLVTKALGEAGFGVLTRIDVHDVFKAKMDVDFRPYTILGACNPQMAHRALETRSDVGLLLPCNVVVEEASPGRALVRIGKPTTLMNVGDLVTDEALGAVAAAVAQKLDGVGDELRAHHG